LRPSDLILASIFKELPVLVLIENVFVRDSHSMFFKFLKDRGYHLVYKYADDASLDLKHLEVDSSNFFICQEFGGNIDVKKLTRFVDEGGNILVAGSPDIGEAIKDFGSECGIEFDDEKTAVIDHMNYDVMDEGKVTVISSYQAIALSIASNPANPLVINVLHASDTAYSHSPDTPINNYPNTVGRNTQLITGLQARNDARVLFVGSLDFFSDEFFLSGAVHTLVNGALQGVYDVSGNRELSENLALWTFKENGVLRVSSIHHNKVGEKDPRREYTIKDDIIFSIDIEMKGLDGAWKPFVADDVQVELIRIDPFIRRTLPHKGNKYEVQMKLPDVYGVFKLVVDYHRTGYTHLFTSNQISVRPFTHTQYERFIISAYPYYASAISMMAGVSVFSFVYLYLRDDKLKAE
uniref:Dolichyl-diphosphooligosaccharide--protein glycosyltransferase 48 kDa subunit n=1 Tax=Schistocephalus solidus TaxID=70667 RepID=A0A183SQC0_SCHSO